VLVGSNEQIAGEVAKIRAAAEAAGRGKEIRFGIRVDVIARDTEEEAWAEVRRFYESIPHEQIEAFSKARPRDESVGAHRQWALHNGKVDKFEDLIVSPNLWAGKAVANGAKGGQVGGPTCVLVGSNEQIAERLAEYVDVGITTFILAAKPHLEEAYRVGEYILPRVDGALDRLRTQRASRAIAV
jgi:alkanesulfonate monooxygenase